MNAAPKIASTGPGLANTRWNWLNCEATATVTPMPMNIAMPPSRGVGRVCTSRSRIFGIQPILVAQLPDDDGEAEGDAG